MIREGRYYRHPVEKWNKVKCEKAVKHVATDGLGTPYPWPGYIGSSTSNQYGQVRYNGGCIRNGDWWAGEIRPLPKVVRGFKIVLVPTWGYRIVKTQQRKPKGNLDVEARV